MFVYNGVEYASQDEAKAQLLKDIYPQDLVSVDDRYGIYRTSSLTYTIEEKENNNLSTKINR